MDDEQPDAVLLGRLADGDVDVLGALFDRHHHYALGLAVRVLGERTRAEEVVQDAFLTVMRRAVAFEAARGSFRSWLLSIVHHKSVDVVRREEALRRREMKEHRLAVHEAEPDPADEAMRVIQAEQVRDALARLTDNERRAIETAYFGGYSYRQTAELLEAAEGTVKSWMRSGLRKLRDELEKKGAFVAG